MKFNIVLLKKYFISNNFNNIKIRAFLCRIHYTVSLLGAFTKNFHFHIDLGYYFLRFSQLYTEQGPHPLEVSFGTLWYMYLATQKGACK